MVCHKVKQIVDGGVAETYIPIGIKPQNLNFNYIYADGSSKNQLTKWVEQGYLQNNFSLPTEENSTVNYNDASKPLSVRARSYVDANCAHCHKDERHCDYRAMRFAFNETKDNNTNMGVCINAAETGGEFPAAFIKVVAPGNINRSMMYYRLSTNNESQKMPLHGRTIVHDEGLALMGQWINSLAPCP